LTHTVSSTTSATIAGSNDKGVGLKGVSTGSLPVFPNFSTSIGVFGEANNGIGVRGESDNIVGVSGASVKGTGVYGSSNTGFAMQAEGTVKQSLSNTGWVKAALNVSKGIEKCYNSQATDEASAESCNGFSGSLNGLAGFTVIFPFRVDNRFIQITAEGNGISGRIVNYQFTSNNNRAIIVYAFDHKGNRVFAENFTVLVF
jgi:hypothetical protein